MGDSTQDLYEALEELHEALEANKDFDSVARVELKGAIDEINQALGDTEGDGPPDSILGLLREAVERWEQEHPKLTEVIGRVADALSDLGI